MPSEKSLLFYFATSLIDLGRESMTAENQ